MESKTIPINQIEGLSRARKYFETFTDLIKSQGPESLPPIPVFRVPEELHPQRPYANMDGGHRLSGHVAAGESEIRCIVFGPQDDPEEVAALTGNGHAIDYDACVRAYKRRRKDSPR